MPRPPAKALSLSDGQRDELIAITRHRATPQSIVLRLRILLGAADGVANKLLARQVSTTGMIIAQCQPRHRHQEFLLFLDGIEASVPRHLEVHIILDNYGTYKHPAVRKWFTEKPR